MRKRWVLPLIAAMLLFPSCSLIPKEEELPNAPVLRVQNTNYTQTAVARGDLIQTEKIECKYLSAVEETLRFSQDGEIIARIYVRQGDLVRSGDLIAELDNTQLNQSIDAQNNVIGGLELQTAQAKERRALLQERISLLTEATKEDAHSYADLLQSAALSLNESDSRIDYLNSLLRIERQRLLELQQKLAERRLYAGIDGTAQYVLQSEGKNDLISGGQTVCVLSDLSDAAFTAQTKRGYFSVGDTVAITYDDAEHEAVVSEITEAENDRVKVWFRLSVPDPSLSAEKKGSIFLVTNTRENVLYLPKQSVIAVQNAKLVYYLDEDGIKNSKVVTTGLEADGKVEILSGLEEGELVIR